MNILVVGAGAVGQVYALYLAKAGHQLSFFVKEKYVNNLKQGLTLHHLSRFSHRTQQFSDYGVISDVADIAAKNWQQVWLALPSDALRGESVASILAAVGDATVVCLQPDINDGDRVRRIVPATQVVQGMIPFISFQSPLPKQEGLEGLAYFLPPLVPTLLAGEQERVQAVYRALEDGGLRARIVPDFVKATAINTALFQSLIATLESNDWQLNSLPSSPQLKQGLKAAQQAVAVVAAKSGASTISLMPLFKPLTWKLLLPIARHLFPFNLEVYLQYHFSKVGVQTRLMLESYMQLGEELNLPTSAIATLRKNLPEVK